MASQVSSARFLSRPAWAEDADLLGSFSGPKERDCGEPHSPPKVPLGCGTPLCYVCLEKSDMSEEGDATLFGGEE